MASYSRISLRKLALAKFEDAALLFAHGRYSNTLYLGGYAVELGLKAAVTRQFSAETLPDRRLVVDAYTHKLPELVRLAGLQAKLRHDLDGNPNFAANWGIISTWDESARYESFDPVRATGFMSALSDPIDGVFPWVKMHW